MKSRFSSLNSSSLKVSLLQSSSGLIRLRLQTIECCLQISTSNDFDPYTDLYAWLGKVRDGQLPATLIIDEAGYGVKIVAEEASEQLVDIRIIDWLNPEQDAFMELRLSRHEIVEGFCSELLDFTTRDNHWKSRSFFRSIINLDWRSLMQNPGAQPINWQHWLVAQGGPEVGCREDRDQSQLSSEQQWAATLYQAMSSISVLVERGRRQEAMELAALFQNLPISLAFGRVHPHWYAERLTQLCQEYSFYHNVVSIPGFEIPQPLWEEEHMERVHEQRRRIYEQHKSLKVGQLVEGVIAAFRDQGAFVKIGELHVLLPKEEISHFEPAYPDQVFQIGDRIKALVIFAHEYRMRIAISTRELEKEPGDMLRDPEMVYATAEEMAERYRELVISRMS